MRVAEIAELTGTTVRTVRYYHSLGLLPVPAERGGWRDYELAHVARLSRIRWLVRAGLSLEAVGRILGESDGAASLTDRLALLDARRELVGGDLDAVAQALSATHAPLLDLLETAARAGAGRCQSVDAARALLGDGFPEVLDLADLAGAVRDLAVPYEAEDLRERLRQVREALAEL